MTSALSAAQEAVSLEYRRQKDRQWQERRPGHLPFKTGAIDFKAILFATWNELSDAEKDGMTFEQFSESFGKRGAIVRNRIRRELRQELEAET